MQLINKRHLTFAFVLGFMGLLLNLMPIPLFGNQQLIIGNLFFVIVAVFLGPWYALLTALMCASGLYIVWDSWHPFILFPLEALWLGYARRKEYYSLYADIGYWVIVGMPLFYILVRFVLEMPDSYMFFTTLKQGINGILYTSLGAIIITMLPQRLHIAAKLKNQHRKSFNHQLSYTFTQLLTLVLLVSALIFSNLSINHQQLDVKRHLEDTALHLGKATETYLDNHISAIDTAARWLSFSAYDSEQWQSLLSKLHKNYPDFISMLIANEQGIVTLSSPVTNMQQSQDNAAFSIIDRHYFQQAFFNQITYISPVFLGRGFGNDPIVAISAALYLPQSPIAPIGIIEGSLNLAEFSQIYQRIPDKTQHDIVLVDENNLVIYASPALNKSPLSEFVFSSSGFNYKTSLAMLNIKQLKHKSPEFAYAKHIIKNGWTLYVLTPFYPLVMQVERQYFTTFSILLLSFLVTFALIKVVSLRLTKPLEAIAKKFHNWHQLEQDDTIFNDSTPQEIFTLSRSILKSKQELISYQLELEEKVAHRTIELQAANTKLRLLAEKDELTQLYNRRYTETHFPRLNDMCQRSCAAMAFCILDIDHFKSINDTHGHQAGDNALIFIADMMKQCFKRDTDVISRYGGEEFLIILPLCNPIEVKPHLDKFRQSVSDTPIPIGQNVNIHLTISIGAVYSDNHYHSDIDYWFKQADINLYQAKTDGRDRVICNQLTSNKQDKQSTA
ncbi:diguanylate cyclase [Shewanella algidipiscicola]|uniref:diguanylate cyclase n=1 Tax=Shewanella algidipiscicola TaxID=614070 RepID=A0ABQ4PK11_9GAMM|nr:diguanylate cyclase [Shewanella algidipiscicola]GIU48055.1 hypothetical protein TUM4630_23520 [Shewanella algidipiscicola]